MSLIHDTVVTLPNNPAYEVSKNPWNAEHKFPGAGAGEVVFVDGSGHAATSADLTFDAASKTLSVGVFAFIDFGTGGFQLADTNIFYQAAAPDCILNIGTGLSDPSTAGIINLYGKDADGNSNGLALGPISLVDAGFSVAAVTPQSSLLNGSSLYLSGNGKAYWDATGAGYVSPAGPGFGTDGTGYFGTSVVVGATPFTFNETAGVLQLGVPELIWTVATQTLATPGFADVGALTLNGGVVGGTSAGAVQYVDAGIIGIGGLGSPAFTFDSNTQLFNSPGYSVGGVPGQSGTVSAADLTTQSLSFVNGIYMGLV